jgi:hypothetical protein
MIWVCVHANFSANFAPELQQTMDDQDELAARRAGEAAPPGAYDKVRRGSQSSMGVWLAYLYL